MVNLTTPQQTVLTNVEREKAAFDAAWADEERRHRLREEELKRPVRMAIALADQTGVPSLRIAKAAGFNQTNQLANWMRDKTVGGLLASSLGGSQKPVEVLQQEVAAADVPTFLEAGQGVWKAIWHEDTVDFTLFNYGGGKKVAVVDGETPSWFEPAVAAWDENVIVGWPEDE